MDNPHLAKQFRSLVRGIKIVCIPLALFISSGAIRTSSYAGKAEQIFQDMLSGKPLPGLTVIVVQSQGVLLPLALLLPLVAIAALFTIRDLGKALTVYSIALIASIGLHQLVWHALSLPFINIIQNMTGM